LKYKLFIFIILYSCLFARNYEDGIKYYKKTQYKKAKQSFLLASNNNDNKAMLALGIMYANGDGVKKDGKKSLDWFIKSANAGNIHAYLKLGNIYASKKYFEKAFKWFEKAAMLGNAKASYYLGYFYTGGLGVKADLKKAFKWYQFSAKNGNINAQINLGFSYISGLGTTKSYKKAAFWIKKAKNTGNLKAITLWEQFKLNDYE
jgi:TPR repeat protein